MRALVPVGVAVLLAGPSLAAQPHPGPAYQDLVDHARVTQAAGDHQATLDLLRAAQRLRPSLTLRWAVAFEALQAGDRATARTEAEACEAEAGGGSFQGRALPADARTAIEQCGAILTRLRQTEPAGASAAASPATAAVPAVAATLDVAAVEALIRQRLAQLQTTQAPPRRTGPGIGPVVLLSVGGASLVAAGVFYGLRASALSSCDVQGSTAYCDPGELDRARQAPTWATAGHVALGVGLAAVAGGAIWWAVGGGGGGEHVAVGLGPGRVTVEGRF